MKKLRNGLGKFRVITGEQHDAGDGEFIATAFHMTFYAKDIRVLKFLITFAQSPLGSIVLADHVEETPKKYSGKPVEFSAN